MGMVEEDAEELLRLDSADGAAEHAGKDRRLDVICDEGEIDRGG